MATTTNYGWTTPDDTDLVRNGADAIRVLGSAIDTTLYDAIGVGVGLTLIDTYSFSAVASQNFNDVFDATYDNYMLRYDLTLAADLTLTFRWRAAGSDNTTANYQSGQLRIQSDGNSFAISGQNATSYELTRAPYRIFRGNMWVQKPAVAERTSFFAQKLEYRTTTPFTGLNQHGGVFNDTTIFDGFSLIASTSNFTGSVTAYGVTEL